MKFMVYVFMMVTVLCSSCSKEEDPAGDGKPTPEQVIARFKSYFYRDGKVNATKATGSSIGEWVVVAKESARAREVFEDITGKEAPLLMDNYNYKYVSPDGNDIIELKGSDRANEKAVYAAFYVQFPDCPEISKILVVTWDYFKGTNDDTHIEGVPVIL